MKVSSQGVRHSNGRIIAIVLTIASMIHASSKPAFRSKTTRINKRRKMASPEMSVKTRTTALTTFAGESIAMPRIIMEEKIDASTQGKKFKKDLCTAPHITKVTDKS